MDPSLPNHPGESEFDERPKEIPQDEHDHTLASDSEANVQEDNPIELENEEVESRLNELLKKELVSLQELYEFVALSIEGRLPSLEKYTGDIYNCAMGYQSIFYTEADPDILFVLQVSVREQSEHGGVKFEIMPFIKQDNGKYVHEERHEGRMKDVPRFRSEIEYTFSESVQYNEEKKSVNRADRRPTVTVNYSKNNQNYSSDFFDKFLGLRDNPCRKFAYNLSEIVDIYFALRPKENITSSEWANERSVF